MHYELIRSMKGVAESFSKMSARSYEEYINELEDGDIISIISVYLKAKFRDKIGYLAEESVRTLFHDVFTKACRRITINKQMVLDRMDKVDKNSFDPYHFSEVNKEINLICDELRELNKELLEAERERNESIKTLLNSIDKLDSEELDNEELNTPIEKDAFNTFLEEIDNSLEGRLNNIATQMTQFIIPEIEDGQIINNFKVAGYSKTLSDNGVPIISKEKYIISQYPGQNEKNIGAYVGRCIKDWGQGPTEMFFCIPLGTQYTNKYVLDTTGENLHLSSPVKYFTSLDGVSYEVIGICYNYLKFRNRLKKEEN